MKHRTCGLRAVVFALLLLAVLSSAVFPQTWTKPLAEGVTLAQKIMNGSSPQIINIVTVDPKAPGVRFRAVLGKDRVLGDTGMGCEIVSSVARRLNAAAVVNADFFPIETPTPGDPLNLQITGGELISEPTPQRVAVGITCDGRAIFDRMEFDARITLPDRWFPIRGVNRPRKEHELVAYTRHYFTSTRTGQEGSEAVVTSPDLPIRIGVPMKCTVSEVRSGAGDTPIPEGAVVLSGKGTGAKFIDEHLRAGTEFTMEFTVKPQRTTGWEKVVEAVGGGSWLVREGKEFVDAKDQGFGSGFYAMRHPRTAVGTTQDGKIVLATVDGRQSISFGMTLSELAQVMLSQGCVEAINLDGGGSTTMATALGLLNSPSGSRERAVANSLAVFANPLPADPAEFAVRDGCPVQPGKPVQLTLVDGTGQPLPAEAADKVVWTSTGGAGFVDQCGKFYGLRARKGQVVASLGSRSAAIDVETIAGPPAIIKAALEPDPGGDPNKAVVRIAVTDANSNPVKGQKVALQVTGGAADQAEVITDDGGKASANVAWAAPADTPGQVVVTTEGLAPVIVDRLR